MLNGKLDCASIFFGKNMPRHMCLPQWKIGHFRSGLSIETTALDYKNGCVLSSDYLSYRAAFGARVQCGHPRSSKLISMFGSKHKAHLCIILSSYKCYGVILPILMVAASARTSPTLERILSKMERISMVEYSMFIESKCLMQSHAQRRNMKMFYPKASCDLRTEV